MSEARKVFFGLLALGMCVACSGAPAGVPNTPAVASEPVVGAHALDAVTIPVLPEWTDKYADQNAGDMRFFAISELMARYGLDRTTAVELQNHFRDATRADPGLSAEDAFGAALELAQAGVFERLDRAALEAAAFIVVFDLDATLYDQHAKGGEACAEVQFTGQDGAAKALVLAPGWQQVLSRVRAAGGAIVIFSANVDELVEANLRHWQWDGVSLWEHPEIAGVLTNSHLTLQSKHEEAGKTKPRKGSPVAVPSKDLRVLDSSLERVILVDDNPQRVVQHHRQRLVKKLDGELLCATKDGDVRALFERSLLVVATEIEESAAYAQEHHEAFAHAYAPYTMLGRVAVDALMETRGWDVAASVAFVRAHPELVDSRF